MDHVPQPTVQELLADAQRFSARKKRRPDEWWVCLGTCWKRSWCISKGVLTQGLENFISRPAQVPFPQTPPCLPPYLPSLASPGHLTAPLSGRDGERGQMLEPFDRKQEWLQTTLSQDPCPDRISDIVRNGVFQWLQTGRTSTMFTLVVAKDCLAHLSGHILVFK